MTDFLVGLDVEGFIRNEKEFIPATGLIGGNKRFPRPVENGALQEDNVMFEINVTPTNNAKTLRSNIASVVAQLREIVVGQVGPKAELLFISSANFSPTALYAAPNFAEFGCSEDFDAYSGEVYEYPDFSKGLTRYAGGHLHVGALELSHPGMARKMIKTLDYELGGLYYALHPEEFAQSSRHLHYGRLGNYRIKPYGIEYRTLPPGWIWDNKFIDQIFTVVSRSLKYIRDSGTTPNSTGTRHASMQKAVAEGNTSYLSQLYGIRG